jgi:hypothetical protein
MNRWSTRNPKAQKFESVRPELLIGHAPGTMKEITIKIISVIAFYEIVWYHAHMQISPSYAMKRIPALVPRSRVLGWLSQSLGRPQQDVGRSADPSAAQAFFRSDVAG